MQAFEILKAEVKFNTVPIQPVEPSIWFLPKLNRFKARVVASIEVSILKKYVNMGKKKLWLPFRIQQSKF
jgi:hypothetical protein